MKDLKHFSKVKKKALTFMIIPNSAEKVITFQLPYWILLAIVLSFSIILLTTLGFSGFFIRTNHQLQVARQDMLLLNEENQKKSKEIVFLRNSTMEIEKKLVGLNELENQVLSLVGLTSKNRSVNNEPIYLVSRSQQRSFLDVGQVEYEEDIKRLDTLIKEKEINMQQLIEKVEKQINYLDALPNIMPTAGNVSSPFGYRNNPFNSRKKEFHQGIDISNKTGTKIHAAGSGIVTFSGYNGGYGRMIIISHGNGYTSIYAHNSKNTVEVGAKVNKGDSIAYMGSTGRSTGSHVHFEIRQNGSPINPTDLFEK